MGQGGVGLVLGKLLKDKWKLGFWLSKVNDNFWVKF
jgi:hypothetical protein